MKTVTTIVVVLLIVGGLNWGLVGVFDYNLVDSVFGEGSGLTRVIYALVGVAAVVKAGMLAARLSGSQKV